MFLFFQFSPQKKIDCFFFNASCITLPEFQHFFSLLFPISSYSVDSSSLFYVFFFIHLYCCCCMYILIISRKKMRESFSIYIFSFLFLTFIPLCCYFYSTLTFWLYFFYSSFWMNRNKLLYYLNVTYNNFFSYSLDGYVLRILALNGYIYVYFIYVYDCMCGLLLFIVENFFFFC